AETPCNTLKPAGHAAETPSAYDASHQQSERSIPDRSTLNDMFNFYGNTVMKSVLQVAVLTSFLASFSAFAHHPAEDIVDEEIYEMIDENVADTPHADLDFTSMGL
ncbi:MAG: hypothetical protein Q8M84_09950, partial [Thiobacillus sp.]|nr:hypothetical protein [Thiobacillus sp.]